MQVLARLIDLQHYQAYHTSSGVYLEIPANFDHLAVSICSVITAAGYWCSHVHTASSYEFSLLQSRIFSIKQFHYRVNFRHCSQEKLYCYGKYVSCGLDHRKCYCTDFLLKKQGLYLWYMCHKVHKRHKIKL